MAPEFIRLFVLEKVRSLSLGRDILTVALTFIFIAFILVYLAGFALFFGTILKDFFEIQDVPAFLNVAALYYLFCELSTRFILQKKPLFELRNILHLPVKKTGVIHYLLSRSLFSPFSLLVIILFLPVTITEISPIYGPIHAAYWLSTLLFLSFAMHFLVLWLKQVIDGSLIGIIAFFGIAIAPFILLYFGLFTVGEVTAPFFALSISGPASLVVAIVFMCICYLLIHRTYRSKAYLDSVSRKGMDFLSGTHKDLFSRFGVAGMYADTELKLILRHKRSRSYLIMSLLFLFYGLIFYRNDGGGLVMEIPGFSLFIGIFIISIFFINYGQFFISWNTASFDYYMLKHHGLEALVRGKMLVLITVSLFLYLLSMPYLYFGWQIIILHTVALLYNIGIGVHVVVRLALWQPKPMDINKGAMFNYEGTGIAQFLIGIPFFALPYVIYVPVSFLFDAYTALAAVGLFGIIGIIFYDKMVAYSVRALHANRHNISSRFRQSI